MRRATRTSIPYLFALALSPLAASAASITMWDQSGFRGASTVVDDSVSSLSEFGWNDRVSSLRVESGRWEVCRDPGFGRCRTLDADEFATLDSSWNDAISSVRPVNQTATTAETAQQVAARVYRALLGRDGDPAGLRVAANQIAGDQLETVVRGMAQSVEYRRVRTARSAPELLDQMFRAILERPADSIARRAYLSALERGEDAEVVIDLLGSEEYRKVASGSTAGDEELSLTAEGTGLVIWGSDGKYEAVHTVSATLGRDGRARIDLRGPTDQTLAGTWTREADDLVSLRIPDLAGRRLNANGRLQLSGDRLARLEVIAGTPGARSSAVMTFVADGYEPPREEMLCHQEARAQLEDERGAALVMVFLQPERSSVSSSRDELVGDAFVLSEPARFTYTCDVDKRRGQVLDAAIRRR
jgi:Beta/Gamma crystallin